MDMHGTYSSQKRPCFCKDIENKLGSEALPPRVSYIPCQLYGVFEACVLGEEYLTSWLICSLIQKLILFYHHAINLPNS